MFKTLSLRTNEGAKEPTNKYYARSCKYVTEPEFCHVEYTHHSRK